MLLAAGERLANPDSAQTAIDEIVVPFLAGELPAGELLSINGTNLEQIVRVAIAAFGAGDNDRAMVIFEAVRALAPNFVVAHHYIGMIEERRGDPAAAVDAYLAAGALLEGNSVRSPSQEELLTDVLLQTGRACIAAGRTHEAIECLTELRGRSGPTVAAVRPIIDAVLATIGSV